jgi:hypothetical protein
VAKFLSGDGVHRLLALYVQHVCHRRADDYRHSNVVYGDRLRLRAGALAGAQHRLFDLSQHDHASGAGDADSAVHCVSQPRLGRDIFAADRAVVFRQSVFRVFAAPIFDDHPQ